ncbi:dTDP-4-dehydrorhamnose reductase [Alteromonas oceanisediminis]|uniref:dTDP-4-dehydrorhamnose reductase n=1 Tax=Alteromonas oceanisediminis TaxID=2836180 RepID=UPI001BD9E699|nr:dTDP-4-dehydrorhamnose reductase [Alteromonas oceanisediminis]MBT0585696.1 dTDP-4-dehydrorhamnose reductase [Alteromonas oceanisediminis]
MNILVVGRSGQLANELKDTQPSSLSVKESVPFDVTYAGRDDVDVLDQAGVSELVKNNRYDVVINTAAYTAVDKAESEPDAAYALNETAVRHLAVACGAAGALLIHVSTDFVFNSTANSPFLPEGSEEFLQPQSVYGKSKLAGEVALRAHCPDSSVLIRTSWLYSTHGANFVKTMLKVMQQRPELAVVDDQIGSPTYAKGLAQFIWAIVARHAIRQPLDATYHWSDQGHTSWFGFAEEIARQAIALDLLREPPLVKKTTTQAYNAPAPRPAYSVMNCNTAYEIWPGSAWQHNLSNMLKVLKVQGAPRN